MKQQKHALSKEQKKLKKRIKRTHAKAKWVGFFYLIATIALAALACLPMITAAGPIGVGLCKEATFWSGIKFEAANLKSVDFIVRALYAVMLLAVVINVFKSLGNLGWLYKRKASKEYGYDRNVMAMQKMGKIFSGSLACIIIFNLLIALVSGNKNPIEMVNNAPQFVAGIPNALILIAAGVFFHIFLGFWGAKISLFPIEEGVGPVEQKRMVGRFAALFRNILQLAAVVGMLFYFLQINTFDTLVDNLLNNKIAEITAMPALVGYAVEVVGLLSFMVLVKHATANTEFNLDGALGKGMKNFRVFSFFVFLAFGALFACQKFNLLGAGLAYNEMGVLIIAGIAFAMFVIEVLMRNAPGLPVEKEEPAEGEEVAEEEQVVESDEVDFEYFISDGYIA